MGFQKQQNDSLQLQVVSYLPTLITGKGSICDYGFNDFDIKQK